MDDEKMLSEVEQELAEMKATLLGKREEDPAEESGNREDPDGGAEKTDHRKLDVNFIYVEAVEENEGPAPENAEAHHKPSKKGRREDPPAPAPAPEKEAEKEGKMPAASGARKARPASSEARGESSYAPDAEGATQPEKQAKREKRRPQAELAYEAEDDLPYAADETKAGPAESREERRRRKEEQIQAGGKKAKKSRAGLIFLRVIELIAIGTSFLSSHFLATYIFEWLDGFILIEVTDRFGREAALKFNTWYAGVKAAIIARPEIIAFVVTGVILGINVIVWLVRLIRMSLRRGRRGEE